jgi:hypothetical protein
MYVNPSRLLYSASRLLHFGEIPRLNGAFVGNFSAVVVRKKNNLQPLAGQRLFKRLNYCFWLYSLSSIMSTLGVGYKYHRNYYLVIGVDEVKPRYERKRK